MNPMSMPSDPFQIASSIFKINQAWMYNSAELLNISSRLSASIQAAGAEQLTSVLSENRTPKTQADNPEAALMDAVKNYSKLANKFFNAYAIWLRDYIDKAPDIPEKERQRSMFWVNQLINSISPANCFWTNPSVVQKFLRTKGESMINGLENWLEGCPARRQPDKDSRYGSIQSRAKHSHDTWFRGLSKQAHGTHPVFAEDRDHLRHPYRFHSTLDKQVLYSRFNRGKKPRGLHAQPGLYGVHNKLEKSTPRDERRDF